MSNALTASLVLLIGLIAGLAIGIWFGRSQGSQSSNELVALKALLEKSEERLKESEGKKESQAKIATQMEEMKTTVERMRLQADRKSVV